MIKLVLPAVMALALALPAAAQACQDCCPCPQNDCCKRQKRFAVQCVTKEVCRLKVVCVTDECGCTRRQLCRVPTTVTRKRLVRVNRCCYETTCDCCGGCGDVAPVPTEAAPVEAPVEQPPTDT